MNTIYCVVGITLLISSIYMSLQRDRSHFKDFENLLNREQTEKYQKIIKERIYIYIGGLLLGLLSGIIYYIKYPKDEHLMCKLISIMSIVKLLFYYMYPKSPLMLYSLNTIEQTNAWANIYSIMKKRWMNSIIVGFIGYILIAYSMNK